MSCVHAHVNVSPARASDTLAFATLDALMR